ncbi:ABC transporter permease [Acetanaerobacterium elongatum]|uniref:Putative ABC transport system permease protein n=1 Tax=Acetanaerobacterium elongatum TaxID=258515 RepID=A0A1G9W512_9FIRM|nr:ABC transporter permease [Acetanaerobacterium elongatum]SDM79307.1 putative ABC transport system permease protein [Acetanaerobacterium elongatum]
MNRFFYSRLAVTNIKKNKSLYLPYLLAGTLIISLFYILSSVSIMVGESKMEGGSTMGALLVMSTGICGFFSLIILFYINSFIIKSRKKEFGLYSILGMEKRHISIVMFWEVLITGAVCILLGIVGGAVFSQLLFLLLLKIIGVPAALTFQIPLSSVLTTLILYGAGFAVVLVFDVIGVARTNPIDLLHSSKKGEREPKSHWLLTLFGALALGGGYVLSWTVQAPSQALVVFLPAVLLVIIGTYCLFTAGSIVFLKLLRKNRSYYYQPRNFISVSGMIYRMKQNAAGLASICILATSVLVTLSSTVSLYIGEEDILHSQYPRQVQVTCVADEQSSSVVQSAVADHAKEYGFTVENALGYTNLYFPATKDGDKFNAVQSYDADTYNINFVPLQDYNRNTGSNYTLKDGEALLYMEAEPIQSASFTLLNRHYQIKDRIPVPEFMDTNYSTSYVLIVLPEYSDLASVCDDYNKYLGGKAERTLWYSYSYDLAGDKAQLQEYYGTLRDSLNKTVPRLAQTENIDNARKDFYRMYGTFLFVGIFFVTLFLIATVLIIYYKQITEGYDDHDRFQIMQKVGMSDKEVRGTIQKQVLMVFFLPLGMAVIHIAVAFKVLCKLLLAFQLTNTMLFLVCTIGAVLLFAILYFVVYQLTARTYYRIVQAKN